MAEQPVLVQPIPPQIVNEGASFGPLNLTYYIQSPNTESGKVRFSAALTSGQGLPKGLIVTPDGIMSGIPATNTRGEYEVVATAENDSSIPFTAQFKLTIKERIAIESSTESMNELKSKVWDALKKNMPLPDLGEILNRPISTVELYYLLQRFAVLTIWDVYNLDSPSGKKILQLEGMNKHYNIYDRGSCLVGAPKDLFSHERTLEDALQTARVMAREAYKRNWTIELAGFNKMIRAAWVEIQLLGDKHGRQLDVLHFNPTNDDLRIYTEQAKAMAAKEMGM